MKHMLTPGPEVTLLSKCNKKLLFISCGLMSCKWKKRKCANLVIFSRYEWAQLSCCDNSIIMGTSRGYVWPVGLIFDTTGLKWCRVPATSAYHHKTYFEGHDCIRWVCLCLMGSIQTFGTMVQFQCTTAPPIKG